MKYIYITVLSISYVLVLVSTTNVAITREFVKWIQKCGKIYPTTQSYENAFKIFEKNYMIVLRHNIQYYLGNSKFLMELNSLSCTEDKSTWNGAMFEEIPISTIQTRDFKFDYPEPPKSLDYRELGLVAPVQDQGFMCSSCYAFAAACALEGQLAKKYGVLTSLSTQNMVDCSKNNGNYGCDGGYIGNTYEYIKQNQGVANESAYPYVGISESCGFECSMTSGYVDAYKYVTGDENNLKRVLAAVGPLAVGFKGSLESFFYYGSGIYDDPACDSNLDHAVCLVGYGTDNSTEPPTDYWILKNSWSTDWGENGYFKMKMGSNLCGIKNYVIYPII